MKGIDIFCASHAATSIRRLSTMDGEGSSSSSSTSITTIHLGGNGNASGRAIDRYNPIIRDASRIGKLLLNTTPLPPCSSLQQPISPKKKTFRNTSIFSNSKENSNPHSHAQSKKKIVTTSSSVSSKQKQNDDKRHSTSTTKTKSSHDHRDNKKKMVCSTSNSIVKKSSWSCTNPGEFFSPPGSSRYLLTTDHHKSNHLPDFDPLLPPPLVPSEPSKSQTLDKKEDDSSSASASASASVPTSSSHSPHHQVVVVLRVSLHCKGCEKKMRKHLSRMEGVTSFDIDFIAKKLTVVGDVTPLSVLASVSKVKNAQLLTLPLTSSTPSVGSNIKEINKNIVTGV